MELCPANGRSLLTLLAGSYVLASVPHSVWVLQHASDDVNGGSLVVTRCKNNDGELGDPSVWLRDNGLWTSVRDFDWNEWDNPDPKAKKKTISEEVTNMDVQLPPLMEWQKQVTEFVSKSFRSGKRLIMINVGRRAGKSFAVLRWALTWERGLLKGRHIAWAAPGEQHLSEPRSWIKNWLGELITGPEPERVRL